jgi:hypothetical protein
LIALLSAYVARTNAKLRSKEVTPVSKCHQAN